MLNTAKGWLPNFTVKLKSTKSKLTPKLLINLDLITVQQRYSRVETPGSNAIHRYDFYFLIFSATTSPGAQCPILTISKLRINNDREFGEEIVLLATAKAGSPRITDFNSSAHSQKMETITVVIGYNIIPLPRLACFWLWPECSWR